MHIAKAVHAARMAPKGMDTPEQCMVAILHGLEVGLTPLAALQRIAVVNGRPTIWGDGALALVRASGLAERIVERIEGEGPAQWNAVCEVLRKGDTDPVIRTFSVEDAKRARLWGKAGPWTDYPRRMLQMRARAFALRDAFADVLGGLYLREEIEEEARRGNVIMADLPRRITDDEEDENVETPDLPQAAPPLPPMRSLDLRRRLAKEASRLRFRNGWSIRQPRGLQSPSIARAPDPREADARRPGEGSGPRAGATERDARRASEPIARRAGSVEPDDPPSLLQDHAAAIDLFDDALACARDPDTLSEIVEEFAARLNDLPRDVRLSADIVIARHEKRIAAADGTAGGTTDTTASEPGTTP